jgi:Flp pilus assembly protein TadG
VGGLQLHLQSRLDSRQQSGQLHRPDLFELLNGLIDRMARRVGGSRSEQGTAVVGTLVGFLIFMVLLLFSVQILVRLYAASVLTASATTAAETVAESGNPAAAMPAAEVSARSRLGTFGATRTTFTWKEVDQQQVVLQVRGLSPAFLPLPASWLTIRRTVTVRTERFR